MHSMGDVYKRQGVDRPVRAEQVRRMFEVDQIHVCLIIAVKVTDRRKVSSVGYRADVKVLALFVDNISERIHG